jgi:hypothetical protein
MSLSAATLINVDSQPKQFEFKQSGGYQTIDLAAGAIWRYPGNVWIRFNQREIMINADEEFAIWNDTTLGPQRRFGNGSSLNHTN